MSSPASAVPDPLASNPASRLPLRWLAGRAALSVRVRDSAEAVLAWEAARGAVLCAFEASGFPDHIALADAALATLEALPVVSLALGGGDPHHADTVLTAATVVLHQSPSAALHLNLPALSPQQTLALSKAARTFLTEPCVNAAGDREAVLRWFELSTATWHDTSVEDAAALASSSGCWSLKVNHAARLNASVWPTVAGAARRHGLAVEPAGGVDAGVLATVARRLCQPGTTMLAHVFSAAERSGRLDPSSLASLFELLNASLSDDRRAS